MSTLEHPARGTLVEEMRWNRAEDGLRVASCHGYFGGTIDHHNGHYYASDTFGRYVGDYPTLTAAQEHLCTHLEHVLPAGAL